LLTHVPVPKYNQAKAYTRQRSIFNFYKTWDSIKEKQFFQGDYSSSQFIKTNKLKVLIDQQG